MRPFHPVREGRRTYRLSCRQGGDYNLSPVNSSSKRKYVIVNADDYGFSAGVTEGILRAHREGLVTSTTVAANMPAAEAAVGRLAEAPGLGVGVHLNVSQGPPLSKEGRAMLAGEDGQMNRTAAGVILTAICCPWKIIAMRAEFEAQIRWVLDHGIVPTHLDSHRHAHAYPDIFECVTGLARQYNIRFVRWHGEELGAGPWPPAPAKGRRISWLLNAFGRYNEQTGGEFRGTRGTWGVAHTGRIDVEWFLCAARNLPPGVTEIMCHPAAADDLPPGMTRLRESRLVELASLCDGAVKEAFEKNEIELTHYGKL